MLSFISAKEAAEKWNITQRRASVLCSENRFGGISATRNGLRYTIVDTEDELTLSGDDVIKARKVY